MTVDELIDRLTEMPGYREVYLPTSGRVIEVEDRGVMVVLLSEGEA